MMHLPLWLRIYLLGCLITIAYSIHIQQENHKVTAFELICSILLGLFSWLSFITLYIGQVFKGSAEQD